MTMINKLAATTLALLLICPSVPDAALMRIGAAGGVIGKVTALAPEAGAVGRIMESGKTVYHLDKIATDSRSRMQVMLLDETVFTIGPDSEMFLDEFVYDPFTDKGKVTARVTKGVFRFVTGKIASREPSKMKVKLPKATIGIRGTIAGGQVLPDRYLIALLGPGTRNDSGEPPGSIIIDIPSESPGEPPTRVQIFRSGYGTVVTPGSGEKPKVFKLTPAQQALLSTAPKPEPGGTGSEEPGGKKSAKEESGEKTSGALGSLEDTQHTADVAGDSEETQTNGSQDNNINPTPTTWEELATSNPGGNGWYRGSGGWSYTSGGCSPTTYAGDWYMNVMVDFATREIVGGGSYTNMGINGDISASSTLSGNVSMPSTGGTAVHTFQSGNLSNADFAGSKITFQNAGGTPGQAAELNLQYNGSVSVNGTDTAPYEPN